MMGHVLRKANDDWVKGVHTLEGENEEVEEGQSWS